MSSNCPTKFPPKDRPTAASAQAFNLDCLSRAQFKAFAGDIFTYFASLPPAQLAAINIASPLVKNADGSYTYTDEKGVKTTFTAGGGSGGSGVEAIAYDAATGVWTITNADGTSEAITPADTSVESGVIDPATGILTLELADGSSVAIDLSAFSGSSTLVDNGDGTYTHTDGDGAVTVVDTAFDATTLDAQDITELSEAVLNGDGVLVEDAFGVAMGVMLPVP